jgi:outer membrane protein assembly factor BamA
MRRHLCFLLVAISICVAVRPAAAQKFLPKTIKFQGDPEYSDAELLAAAGLKKGVVLGYTEMQDYCKRLLATGAFSTVAFKFDGQDLIFCSRLPPISFRCAWKIFHSRPATNSTRNCMTKSRSTTARFLPRAG